MARSKITTAEFVAKSRLTHQDRYDYTKTIYTGAHQLLTVICPTHGEFEQRAGDHLRGRGCRSCSPRGGACITTNAFVDRALRVHGGRYGYSDTVVAAWSIPVTIDCPIHGPFTQAMSSHLRGHGCAQCFYKSTSSKMAANWLDDLGIPDDTGHREVSGLLNDRKYVVDGYDPETMTVYEFHGDYWHGNPLVYDTRDVNQSRGVTFGKLYEDTVARRMEFLSGGFAYVERWETTQVLPKYP